jgi:hypothetical protein
MQYAAIEKGNTLFKPTLKFIELTSREKMCHFDLKMEVNTNTKNRVT